MLVPPICNLAKSNAHFRRAVQELPLGGDERKIHVQYGKVGRDVEGWGTGSARDPEVIPGNSQAVDLMLEYSEAAE